MILVIAGTRTIDDYEYVRDVVTESRFWPPEKVISGDCDSGPDKLAPAIAATHGIPYEEYEADWDAYNEFAGPHRNRRMARDADALVAIWNGESPGTESMIQAALDENLHVDVENTQARRPHKWW